LFGFFYVYVVVSVNSTAFTNRRKSYIKTWYSGRTKTEQRRYMKRILPHAFYFCLHLSLNQWHQWA